VVAEVRSRISTPALRLAYSSIYVEGKVRGKREGANGKYLPRQAAFHWFGESSPSLVSSLPSTGASEQMKMPYPGRTVWATTPIYSMFDDRTLTRRETTGETTRRSCHRLQIGFTVLLFGALRRRRSPVLRLLRPILLVTAIV
jgi:hypothetical protein